MTPEDIKNLSYTDFIGFVNQWNVPPGAYSTLSQWKQFSGLDKDSRILEIACTSGFSIRELVLATGANGVGVDLSRASIEAAKETQSKYAPNTNIEYHAADAYEFDPGKKFSHVVLGAALKFFPDPERLMRKLIGESLEDNGFFLASPFYVPEPIPAPLIERAKVIFGITVTNEPYKEIMRPYRGLEILYERHEIPLQETEEELHHYCQSTIDRACERRGITSQSTKDAMFARLLEIKKMSNDLRPYQRYVVLVLRYRSLLYPNRFVELF